MDLNLKLAKLKEQQAKIEAALGRERDARNSAIAAALELAISRQPKIVEHLATSDLPSKQAEMVHAWLATLPRAAGISGSQNSQQSSQDA